MRRSELQTRKRQVSYKKEIVEVRPLSKFKDEVINISTNISYNVTGSISKIKNFFQFDNDKQYKVICLLGKKFANKEQAQAYIQTLIWFSYRKLPGITKDINNDTGWGCLIRVGQMALAAGLKTYFESKGERKQLVVHHKVLVAFAQKGGKEEKYSLKKIVQRAKCRFQLNYGNWFTATQICEVLTDLHTKNPMKGAECLSLITFQGGMIYIADMLTKMNKSICQCDKKRILCNKCSGKHYVQQPKPIETMYSKSTMNSKQKYSFINKNSISSKSQVDYKPASPEKKLLVFVCCQLGHEVIGPKQYQQLIEFLTLEFSLGIIGGIPRKGFFFIGYDDDQLIYLDPHFVQEQFTPANLQKIIRSFKCKEMRKKGRIDIDPSLAFVFFIDSLETMKKLEEKIKELYQKYENSIISIQWKNQFRENQRISKAEEVDNEQEDDLQNSFIEQI